ncbi:MAG: malate synthase G [Pseudomonadota bacterium]
MSERVTVAELQIAKPLYDLVDTEVLDGLALDSAQFWSGFAAIVAELGPRRAALLAKRDSLQQQIDAWYRERQGEVPSFDDTHAFLSDVGYLAARPDAVAVRTANVDSEIADVAGPQLVVPVSNARFALNAANARWGSLYDALYGTDAIDEAGGKTRAGGYNPQRGAAVVAEAAAFLDRALPLAAGSHGAAAGYRVEAGEMVVTTADHGDQALARPEQWIGHAGDGEPHSLVFVNNGLHVVLQFDREHPIGSASASGLKDVMVESALTVIQDCEDSVAAVDAEDKVGVYRNWLGLMKGDLEQSLEKGGRTIVRRLNDDLRFTAREGGELVLKGRSLMLVRNVGLLMPTDAVLDGDGNPVSECFMDALVTSACAMHDLNKAGQGTCNSRNGSVYIVEPKMHGPEEVALINALFGQVERVLGLAAHTLKVGVMDEERRTTVNLSACIEQVADRLVFINTGFLDRTGDEIHTLMELGPVLPKADIKGEPWIAAYEANNVDVGLRSGLRGRAQIGKGMWAMPDAMRAMLDTKQNHPEAGANCAWVPSPTAATLHATHYHSVSVHSVQDAIADREPAALADIMTLPLLGGRNLSDEEIRSEIDNNCQGILGYVVRWVDHGVGCSKVPDIHNIELMEDRATLRISSQHLANWLRHGVITTEQVEEALQRMAGVVDGQNESDPLYEPMAGHFDTSVAYAAAHDLIFKGCEQPSGYTEPLLHARRAEKKAQARSAG